MILTLKWWLFYLMYNGDRTVKANLNSSRRKNFWNLMCYYHLPFLSLWNDDSHVILVSSVTVFKQSQGTLLFRQSNKLYEHTLPYCVLSAIAMAFFSSNPLLNIPLALCASVTLLTWTKSCRSLFLINTFYLLKYPLCIISA